MKSKILALRINRRALGVALLSRDALLLGDGRHLPSNPKRAAVSLSRWIQRWLAQTPDATVVLDTPASADGTSMRKLLEGIDTLLMEGRVVPVRVSKPEILSAYGLRPARSRQEVREIVATFWPKLSELSGRIAPFAADAAAAALLAQYQSALQPEQT